MRNTELPFARCWHISFEADGAEFLVGLEEQKHEERLAILRARGIPSIDFDGAPRYPSYGYHWTPAGHAVVARRLLPLLAGITAATRPHQP